MANVTIKDIAGLAGVSCATVSRVLNGAPNVGEDIRTRVLELCRQQGYRRNLLARSLSASRTGLIGCIVSDLDNPLFAELSFVLEQLARQRGCHVMLCHGRAEDPDIRQLFDFLVGRRVDGIILVSASKQAPALIRQYLDRVPVVLQGTYDDTEQPLPVTTVGVDDLVGGRQAAQYLHTLGHRQVAYLGLRENNSSHILRHRGFLEEARRLGMTVRTLPNSDWAVSNTDVGYRLGKRMFFDDFPETAIFAACDSIALGVMAAAREFSISIPEEVSLLGFDNISYAALPNIRLTTFDHCIAQLVEQTLETLLDQIGVEGTPAVQTRRVPPPLLERDTCRRIG